jgi:alcohol dehydrogenase class IV
MNPPPPLLYAPGALAQVGELARRLGFRRTLIVADHGMEQAGHIAALNVPPGPASAPIPTRP